MDVGKGPALSLRTRGVSLLRSSRLSTRLWFDILAPLAMLVILTDKRIGSSTVVIGALSILALHLGSTLVNDAEDVAVDAASGEPSRYNRVLITGQGRKFDLLAAGVILLTVGVGLAFALSVRAGVLVLVSVAVATAYNTPPMSLSGRPVWPQIVWPSIWLLMFASIGTVVETDHWRTTVPFAIFVAVFMGVGEGITQDVRDVDNDAIGGRRTTPVVFGVWKSCIAALLAQSVALGPWLWFCAVYPMPLFVVISGTSVLVGWLVAFAFLARRLKDSFDKNAAKWTHVGPIAAFTVINVLTIGGGLLA